MPPDSAVLGRQTVPETLFSEPPGPMRRIALVVLFAGATACIAPPSVEEEPVSPLVGTWKLEQWRARDSLGVWQEEFGSDPRGYFVYGPDGFLSIHLMHEDGADLTGCGTEDSPEFLVAPRCYVGYFGTYDIEDDSTVIHRPEGGTILSYIGTAQRRRFEVRGDSLWIQRSDSIYRLLVRM